LSEQEYRVLLDAAQRQIQERDLLDQVRTMLERGLELDTVLKNVVESTARTFGYTHVSLYLLEGDMLVLQHQVGYQRVIQRVPVTQGVSGRVARTGQPVCLADVRADPAFLAAADGIVSEVCVPLCAQDRVIGTFNLESTGQMVLGEADLRIALALSQHIGIAFERARLYAALRNSEQRYRGIIEAAQEGIWIIDAESQTTYVNGKMADLLGYSADEMTGMSLLDFMDDDAKAMAVTYLERRRQGIAEQHDFKFRRKDGAPLWVILNATAQMDADGKYTGALAAVTDITERKRAEEATLRRNAELAALNRMGQALSRLVEPAGLLDLIYTVIGQILDNKNLYIALYDENTQTISFPLYTIDGQRISWPSRPLAGGLTEYVIRTKAPLFLPRDFAAGASALGIEPHGKLAQCYLAVPMLLGDKVSGVIAIQDYERADVYDQDHLEILSTIAAQAASALENARLFAETRRRADQLQAINDVERVVTTTLDLELLSAQIAQVLHTRLNLDAVAVGLVEGDELVYKAASGPLERSASLLELRLKVGREGVTGRVAASGETLLVPDVRLYPGFIPAEYLPHTLSELAVPLKTQAGIIGVLNIESEQVDAFGPDLVALIETLASQIAIAIENARLFAETKQLARTDPLTGIPNRRYLFEVGERELSRARRFAHPLAAFMLDIDHFKQVNDAHGHALGDQVLRALAHCCLKNIRDIDTVGRYGGEEFVVLLVETDSVRAHRIAERLRDQVSLLATDTPLGPVRVTVSLGVAARMDGDDLTTLLARADQALYAAKQAGRNRVAVL
jgi:diguanylate cyclase (GGDEF)-like protein/PAS domain S-box-containing protein